MIPVFDGTLWDLIEERARTRGSHPAFTFPEEDITVSYGEFRDRAWQAARALVAMGLEPGEHIALWAPSGSAMLEVHFGALASGHPLALFNVEYRIMEIQHVLALTEAVALVADDSNGSGNDFIATLAAAIPELQDHQPGEWHSDSFPHLRYVVGLGDNILPGMISWADLESRACRQAEGLEERHEGSADEAQARPGSDGAGQGFAKEPGGDWIAKELAGRCGAVNPQTTAYILFTSGTTGDPKGVMQSHRSVIATATGLQDRMGFTPEERIIIPVPIFHGFGLAQMHTGILAGVSNILFPRFQAREILDAASRLQATCLCGTATMFSAWLEAWPDYGDGLDSIRLAHNSGVALKEELGQALFNRGIKTVFNMMGITETICISCLRAESPEELVYASTGPTLQGMEVMVVEPGQDGGEALPDGQTGEMLVRGHSVMQGYYRNPAATAAAFDGAGWFHSGDLVYRDSRGHIFITGRIKDMINRGGTHLFPQEIEQYMMKHPKILEAQVVGIPSDYYGEEPVAFVILRPGETAAQIEIKRYCREHMALSKVPVYVFFVDSYPRTASGKVQKYKLAEQARAILDSV